MQTINYVNSRAHKNAEESNMSKQKRIIHRQPEALSGHTANVQPTYHLTPAGDAVVVGLGAAAEAAATCRPPGGTVESRTE